MEILTPLSMESIIFEVLPPPITWTQAKIDNYCSDVAQGLLQQKILYVGIPEVVKESRNGFCNLPYVPKIDNVEFAKLLKERHTALVPVIYKICARLNKAQFTEWLHDAYSQGIRYIVLVGAESHSQSYPGYSVLEACQHIKEHYPDICLGGITIFTRHGEVERIKQKHSAGIDFFFSQILFEATNMKLIVLSLLRSYRLEGKPLPMVYASFAQPATLKSIEFMKWLGVEFPSAVLHYLTEEDHGTIVDNSTDILKMLLDEIFHFVGKEKIPLGFNIEHVMYDHITLSQKLFKDIKERIANG